MYIIECDDGNDCDLLVIVLWFECHITC